MTKEYLQNYLRSIAYRAEELSKRDFSDKEVEKFGRKISDVDDVFSEIWDSIY